jgi:hypothetical protein
MHILYTTKRDADVEQFSVRNPNFFAGVEANAIEVTIDGDYPQIADEYAKAGVEVHSIVDVTPLDTAPVSVDEPVSEAKQAPAKRTRK